MLLPYAKQTWVDLNTAFPPSAARFQHIEDGLEAVSNSLVLLNSAVAIDPATGDIVIRTASGERVVIGVNGAVTLPPSQIHRQQLALDALIRAAAVLVNPLAISGCDLWFDAQNIGTSAPAYAYDSFGRADSAAALGTSDCGIAWTAQNGTLGISGHAAYLAAGAAGDASLVTGVPDAVVEATITLGATGTAFVYINPRVVTSNSKIQVSFRKDGANDAIQATSVVAGTTAQLTNGFNGAAGLTQGQTFRIKIVAKGATYLIYVNGTLKMTATDGGNNFLTSAAQGIGFASSDVLSRVSAFSVGPLDLADNDTVSAWPELSQNAARAYGKQATSANRPTYKATGLNNLPSVRFNGTSMSLPTAAPSTDKPVTIVAVVTRTGAGVFQAILGSTNGGLELRVNASNVLEALVANTSTIGAGVDTVPTTACVVALTYDGNGTYAFYINGRPSGIFVNQKVLTAAQTAIIGALSASDWWNGDIGEIVRYNRVLYGEELRALTGSLALKWGITLPPRIGQAGSLVPLKGLSRIRGANISPNATESAVDGTDAWVGLWSLWNWTTLKDRVDKAVNQGANTIRLIGDIQVVFNGTITQATYLARLEQLVAYLQSIGVNYYHCGGDLRHTGGAPASYIQSFLVAQAGQLLTHTNVVAFEFVNELGAVYTTYPEATLLEWVAQWSGVVRAVLPAVPVTVSGVGSTPAAQVGGSNSPIAGLGDYARLAKFDPYVDFFDVHLYATAAAPITAQDVTPYFAICDKPLMLGEVGADRNVFTTGAAEAAAYQPIADLLAANPKVIGANHWDITSDRFGLYNAAGALQTDTPPIFATFPKRPA